MASLTPDLGRDEPEAYIARDRRWALARREEMPDRVQGAALFADISGFTPLTEALADELGSQRGAEELTAHLGRVFHAVIEELDQRGGEVIYFSGDAITCWLDGDDGLRATAAALAMQDAMAREGTIRTPGGATVQLALKVAVATGPARRFVVGDPDIQLIDVLAGALIDDLADAEHVAEKGEVVLDPSTLATLGDRVRLAATRSDHVRGRTYGVVEALLVEVPTTEVREPPPLDEALVRPWLLPAVYERLLAGRGELLAELRPAFPVFLRFGGIDYDDDPEAIAKLDDFVRRAQRIMAGYGGNVLQLTLGDKGAYLYGVFGSPIAHEDDAARAAAAALDLRDLEASTAAREIQVGITHGRLRSGTYGHAMRRTFVCLGDAVNLAARLMSKAPAGSIWVGDDVRDMAGDAYLWERLPDLTVKGKSATIVAHALRGSLERASRRKTRFELALVGRRAELEALDSALELTVAGDGRIVGIAADAGMGKSRLVAEFVRSARRRGLLVAFGECQSFGTNTSYFVWREIWRRLFDLDDEAAPDTQRARIDEALRAIDPRLVDRAPLLGTVLGLAIPDTELTAAFDAKLRKASLEDLLTRVLRARAEREPVVLIIEDGHWIDALSRDLLEVLGRATAAMPVLIVLAYRPSGDVGGGLGVERIPDFTEVTLSELSGEDAGALIRSKLAQVLGSGGDVEPSDELVRLVLDRSGGNPFYIEELISFITGRGVDLADAGAIARLELPESLHSLVLSRIDQLDESPRRTLKVASVVGRLFEAPMLPGAYPELGALNDVLEHLATLRAADLVNIDRAADHAYLFKHVATQEVAYESLPFAVRTLLHGRIGSYLEERDPDGVDQHLDLLAHHFWHSDDEARKRSYLERAAEAARAAYANAAAIEYLGRLVSLLDGSARVAALLKLGKVQEFVGDWATAAETARAALDLATRLGDDASQGWSHATLAESARKTGRFDEAAEHLAMAQACFERAHDEDGLGQALQVAGTLAAQQGDYDTAQARYEASVQIRRRTGDLTALSAVLANLGIVAEYRGDYAAARAWNEQALAIREERGERWGIGASANNLAMLAIHEHRYAEARVLGETAVHHLRDVGDAWMVAIARNTLGNAYRDLGEHGLAQAAYAASLRAYRDLDDRWAMAFLFEDVGLLAASTAPELAHEFMGVSERLRAETGSPRAPALDEELERALAPGRASIGEAAAVTALARGRAMDLDQACDAVLGYCSLGAT
jgi:adenylate cyclase